MRQISKPSVSTVGVFERSKIQNMLKTISAIPTSSMFLMRFLLLLFCVTEIGGAIAPSSGFSLFPKKKAPDFGFMLQPPAKSYFSTPVIKTGSVVSIARLESLFDNANFDLENIRGGLMKVPPLFLSALPDDFHSVSKVDARKSLFVRIVLPLVLHHNQLISDQRHYLNHLKREFPKGLNKNDKIWLFELAKQYRITNLEKRNQIVTQETLEKLLKRVDIVPVSLALAQSATESGWGTSRFAQKGNALFGQWTWKKHAGIIPKEREPGRNHAIRAFNELYQSVASYIENLNVSAHYSDFRNARAALRTVGAPNGKWGYILAGYLSAYSEEGLDYVKKIRVIIKLNSFSDFETSQLM